MKTDELESVRKRDSEIHDDRYRQQAEKDRRALLAHIDELTAENERLQERAAHDDEALNAFQYGALQSAERTTRLTAENKQLQEANELLGKRVDWTVADNAKKAIQIVDLTAERDEAREALRPFAQMGGRLKPILGTTLLWVKTDLRTWFTGDEALATAHDFIVAWAKCPRAALQKGKVE